jgi:hypothetical protein
MHTQCALELLKAGNFSGKETPGLMNDFHDGVSPESSVLAVCYHNMAVEYEYLGDLDRALQVCICVYVCMDVWVLAVCYDNMAVEYEYLGDLDRALQVCMCVCMYVCMYGFCLYVIVTWQSSMNIWVTWIEPCRYAYVCMCVWMYGCMDVWFLAVCYRNMAVEYEYLGDLDRALQVCMHLYVYVHVYIFMDVCCIFS